MLQQISMLGRMSWFNFKRMISDEKGEVNIVAIVVLIGIAVLLALIFKEQIEKLLESLFKTIGENATNAVGGGGGGE